MCEQCVEEEHFPADCVITMPAPTPRHHSYVASSSRARAAQYGTGAHAAQYSTGAHVAQYGTRSLPAWTSHDSDLQSTYSTYGPPPHHASLYLPSRCHRRPDLFGLHLRRHLPRIPTGASPPGHPRLYRHNTCLQASF